jgi:hypothetical protein
VQVCKRREVEAVQTKTAEGDETNPCSFGDAEGVADLRWRPPGVPGDQGQILDAAESGRSP